MIRFTVIDPSLAELLGLSKTGYEHPIDVVKMLWRYIKSHCSPNGNDVQLDPPMITVFGRQRTTYLELHQLMKSGFIIRKKPLVKLRPLQQKRPIIISYEGIGK